jgi:hypothetical protein
MIAEDFTMLFSSRRIQFPKIAVPLAAIVLVSAALSGCGGGLGGASATRVLPVEQQPAQAELTQIASPSGKGRLVEFDAAGPAGSTFGYDIDAFGTISGYAVGANGLASGFEREPGGNIVDFQDPKASLSACCFGTVPGSLNNFGVIAGLYEDAKLIYHGFVRGPLGQRYETLDDPLAGTGANQGTVITSINDLGAVAGYYADSTGDFVNPSAPYHVFANVNGRYQTIDPPGAVQAQACFQTCINDHGTVTGYYSDAAGLHGLVWSGGPAATPIDVTGAEDTIAASINNQGVIAGYFYDGTARAHGFIRSPGGSITTFDVPKPGVSTVAFSINDSGEVGGSYLDAAQAYHGFVRDSKGKFTYFDAPDAGTGQFQGTRVSVNGPSGAVTGWVTTNSNANRGFVWYPPGFPL